jgi:CBS domain containing-hemolysin-like protein
VTVVSLLILVALLLGNAFFVAAEFALVSTRADQIEPRAAAGSVRAQKTLAAIRNVSQMMAGAQLGITLCSLGLGAVGEPAVAHLIEVPLEAAGIPEGLLHPIALVIALSLITVLHIVIGEMVPKNITLAGPDRAALVLGPALAVMVRLLKPFIWFFNTLANAFVRLFGVQPTDEVAASFDATEIRSMVSQSRQEGHLGAGMSGLAEGALTFEHNDLATVVLPLDRLVTVPRSTTPRQLEGVVADHGFSRYPVCDDGGDLVGYVHVKDVLDVPAERRDEPMPDRDVLPFVELRADSPLPEVLATMRRAGAHLGRVVDDGGTRGIVALEDVLEQLIGDVRDAAAKRRRVGERPEATPGRAAPMVGVGAGGR